MAEAQTVRETVPRVSSEVTTPVVILAMVTAKAVLFKQADAPSAGQAIFWCLLEEPGVARYFKMYLKEATLIMEELSKHVRTLADLALQTALSA